MQLSRTVGAVVIALLLSVSLWLTLAPFVAAESITSFEAEYVIEASSDVLVTERITYDFGNLQRRGIFREVINQHPQQATSWYKTREVELVPLAVTRDGEPERYVNESSDGLFLRIGKAETSITGEHEYVITYKIVGGLSVFDNLTELYWNVTGNGWQVPIDNVSATVVTFGEAELATAAACYAGRVNATASCDSTQSSQNRIVFTEESLLPGEALTIAQAVELPQPVTMIEHINWLPFILGGGLLAFISLIVKAVRWKFRYRTSPAVVAQYEPYQDFKPMFTGVLMDNRVDSRDMTAGIVHLAQQGFISITQIEDKFLGLFTTHDHEVTLKRPYEEAHGRFEKDLLKLLFAGQSPAGEESFSWFGLSPKAKAAAADMSVGKTIRLSDIKKNQPKLRANYKLLQALKKSARADLKELGFLEQGFIISRRTTKGYEALAYLKGFKDFLSVTEEERYAFHNAPDKNPQQFMEYLPYAIAFGVEKEWAEVFKDLTIPEPEWYSSNVAGAHFSATNFASEIGAFSTALASSGSGSSGSSGGGTVGGGGGGGGGGSW